MKTEFPTNGERQVVQATQDRRVTTTPDYERNGSGRLDEAGDRSGEDERQSLFQRPGVIIAAAALAIIGIGYGAFAMFHSFTHESTDDAFVDAHMILTAPKIAGRVAAVHINDNQDVKKGDLLVEIDPADAEAALAQAEAKLGHDQAAQLKADQDLKRQQDLFGKGAISPQDRDTAIQNAATTKADVQTDKAAIQQAELNLTYTKIFAPEDGRVTKKAVEPGDYVQVGQNLFVLVTPERWTRANFKETQLRNMRPGQTAQVSVDAYPDHPLHGHVDSIQAGSGARFSLLPPENATGNYVKVVQRVPVKIVLDEQPDVQRALGPGMSVVPTVVVSDGAGVAFTIGIIAIIIAAGVLVGAALWIGRVRRGKP
ncbi:MAG TPA: HlyD family secretion protein [Chthoniobacterales bacterium]|nr:HlyD family secretion protein [Chthoniobacterales bacterium]